MNTNTLMVIIGAALLLGFLQSRRKAATNGGELELITFDMLPRRRGTVS